MSARMSLITELSCAALLRVVGKEQSVEFLYGQVLDDRSGPLARGSWHWSSAVTRDGEAYLSDTGNYLPGFWLIPIMVDAAFLGNTKAIKMASRIEDIVSEELDWLEERIKGRLEAHIKSSRWLRDDRP